jgi:hypothetical protein
MAALINLQQAKDHLHITDEASNSDLNLKVDQASAIVVRYLKSLADAGWSTGAVPVPGNVSAATLLILGDLYEQRPVDWTAIERLLVSFRDPSLA